MMNLIIRRSLPCNKFGYCIMMFTYGHEDPSMTNGYDLCDMFIVGPYWKQFLEAVKADTELFDGTLSIRKVVIGENSWEAEFIRNNYPNMGSGLLTRALLQYAEFRERVQQKYGIVK